MRSVTIAFAVLDEVAVHQPVGVSELARLLDLPKSTVQRSLRVLAEVEWIRPSKHGEQTRWMLTSRPLVMAGLLQRREKTLRAAATPIMHELGRQTKETVRLMVHDRSWMVLLDKVESTQPGRSLTWIGAQAPIHASAAGLVHLAYLPEERVEPIVAGRLERFTESTVTELPALLAALEEVRARGYAVNAGMWRDEVNAVGAAVLDPERRPIAAITVSTPAQRLPRRLWPQYGAMIHEAAMRISREMYD
ncbi:IclR family transcriptional regulator [Rhizohabitans arisaemae]|uniref:IclR family transcriptional regulator n=1 Tax=Rhizohabitans arisaemae TaxID=2720610 RepID=UPI0024B0A804|nr:IclR family transcriptional regulator [Rhizohabitans arisaemae]